MPRVAKPWFRFYVEAVADPKLRALTPAHRWLWVGVLAAARQSPEPGVLLFAENRPHRPATLADFVGLTARQVVTGLAELEGLGMIAKDDRGFVVVPKFTERQYESDVSTARTRRHRSNEQGRDVPTTPVGTVLGTAPESESYDSPTGESREPFAADFEKLWELYPRKVDRGAAFAAYQARRRDGTDAESLLHAVEHYAEACDGQDRQYVKHGATFLGSRGSWSEWVDGPPLDALGNADLGAKPVGRPEPPSGPSRVEVEQGPRPQLAPWVCALGNPGCKNGWIDDEDRPKGTPLERCACMTPKEATA